ncbi:hypothetical protein GE061_016538 [Apolygus lucorum]|uniref:AB hydrolase-1 domain-containing protein n=1 Tax=Apolygus lucorum TaxID=248454 RepID=A0A8S9XIL2_APOLU|nr:hypothetical protein GE061_016538 [Apolygus lucorum]
MVQHGLSCASTDWVVMNGGLVYRLVDEGCDVWLGNTRGNIYSRSHVTLNPEDAKFWDFSWHEMGYYDLPSMIDYVLAKTQQNRLTYVGHSQGTCVFFVMGSTRPEYNEKISSMFALGPVASLEHLGSILLKQMAVRSKTIHKAANAAGISYITLDTTDTFSKFIDVFQGRVKMLDESMTYVLSSLWGYPCDDLRPKLFTLWVGHVRNGLSLKQLAHFAQSISGEYWFHYYDHGPVTNMRLYGQPTPPPYPLDRITTPVSLLYGPADWLAHPLDVRALYSALSTEKKLIEMPLPLYNHLDFCWSTKCLDNIVDRILKTV